MTWLTQSTSHLLTTIRRYSIFLDFILSNRNSRYLDSVLWKGFWQPSMNSTLFDCVVSDVRMPGVSGLSLVRYLNTRRFARPIILITGHGDIDMAVSAIKIGAFDFIEKPFDETRLLVSIRNAVELERQHIGDALNWNG